MVAHPHAANTVEWFHAWMLVSGALLVGWTIGRSGSGGTGLAVLLLGAVALGLLTIAQGAAQAAHGEFHAVYLAWPYLMHKNFTGTVLAFGATIAFAHPPWLGWSRRAALGAFGILTVGLLLTQSRQAILGLAAALLVLTLRRERGRARTVLLLVAPALALVGSLVWVQVEEGSSFNSLFQRFAWYGETLAYWRESPWLGHGLRFWYRPGELNFQPPNVELEILASAGLLGLAAFGALMGGSLAVLWRLEPAYGTLAAAVLVNRLVQSHFDLFWVAVQVSVPFVIVGICVGAAQAVAGAESKAVAR